MLAHADRCLAQMYEASLVPISDAERKELCRRAIVLFDRSTLVGWVAALVYDTPEGADPAIELSGMELRSTRSFSIRHL